MDRYITVMIVPEKNKNVLSFRIPRRWMHSIAFVAAVLFIALGVFVYDYWSILEQIYENKHLTAENRQLKEQIQVFQMKINALSDGLDRIRIFEKKLRAITGVDQFPLDPSIPRDSLLPRSNDDGKSPPDRLHPKTSMRSLNFDSMQTDPSYQKLKSSYEHIIAKDLGMMGGHTYAKNWTDLGRRSFSMAEAYAEFDYKYDRIRLIERDLEVDIHTLDTALLDKESFLRSTPTLFPAHGWITDYFGPRISPYTGHLKMHEGIDIGGESGTSVIAPADAIVTYSGTKPGLGNIVQLDHGYGIETVFGHNQQLYVRNGASVKRGELISSVGNTGLSTGPHLHYEVRVNGIPVDPLYFILN